MTSKIFTEVSSFFAEYEDLALSFAAKRAERHIAEKLFLDGRLRKDEMREKRNILV